MSGALIALVGNDPCRADELATIVAGLVLSYLQAMHREGECDGGITVEGSIRTSK